MIEREKYLNQLLLFKDTGLIKVVTGVRRCGKSSLLALMQERLRQEGVEANRIISFQMESMEFDAIRDYQSLYATVKGRIESIPRPYLFFDELQEVEGWERTINSLRADGDCDIYITGPPAVERAFHAAFRALRRSRDAPARVLRVPGLPRNRRSRHP